MYSMLLYSDWKCIIHLSVRLGVQHLRGLTQEEFLMADAEVISLDLVTSLSVEQSFPSFL